MKIIVDGEFDISDETGQKVHAVKGDVFYCEFYLQARAISAKKGGANFWQSPRVARLHLGLRRLVWDSSLVKGR